MFSNRQFSEADESALFKTGINPAVNCPWLMDVECRYRGSALQTASAASTELSLSQCILPCSAEQRCDLYEISTMSTVNWTVQCFTSPPTQHGLYGRRFLQVKKHNQQYQSTEGKSCKWKQTKKQKENTNYTYAYTVVKFSRNGPERRSTTCAWHSTTWNCRSTT